MRWECMTSTELKQAVRKTKGVCVIAMGVIEKHSEHLALGTDYLNGHKICRLAAEKEPAVVFPHFYFGQIYEARCFPGTITLKPTLLLELCQAVFDEIGRNGFTKIIIHNAHGGNWHLIDFLAQASLWEEKPYNLYIQTQWLSQERQKIWKSLLETSVHGHACECETSITLANDPTLVKMRKVPVKGTKALGRLNHLKPFFSGISWYSDFPDHYAGDARKANLEKGQKLMNLMVDNLADFIKAVKNDKTAMKLNKEFFKKVRDLNMKKK
ncbi:creatininase family protein [Candidatus Sumerlaeota bacterium]|nr:creatininase family protein [Candidatus Sumerlaeota bacterium]